MSAAAAPPAASLWAATTRGGRRRRAAALAGVVSAVVMAGCGGGSALGAGEEPLVIAGSTSVEPLMRIALRESGVEATLDAEGTNAGLRRLCDGEADLVNASAPMPGPDGVEDLVGRCARNGVAYVELAVALDSVAVVRHRDNASVTDLTTEELTAIWGADSSVRRWSQVREGLGDVPLTLYARGDDSGTFTGFAEQLTGRADGLRTDYRHLEEVDEVARAVAEDPGGLAIMGVGTYLAAPASIRDALSTVSVDGVPPDARSSAEGAYAFARPLLVYAAQSSLERDDRLASLLGHLLENAAGIVPRAYFYPLDAAGYRASREALNQAVSDSGRAG